MLDTVVDQAYKIGAGRYLQYKNVLYEAGFEIKRFGKKALVIGGPTALSITKQQLCQSFEKAYLQYSFREYSGEVCYEMTNAFAGTAKKEKCDIIVGVGGGRMMDLSKAVAATLNLPVITIPTSIATCAAYTPLSIMYTKDGMFKEHWRLEYEVNAVLADMNVLSTQPPRMAAAGIIDSLAKYLEISNGNKNLSLKDCDFQFFTAFQYAKYNYQMLLNYADKAYQDILHKTCSKEVDAVVNIVISLTGIVSALTRARGQAAIAHRIYDCARTFFHRETKSFLHGEIVGVGLLPQLYFNGDFDNIPFIRSLLQRLALPSSLRELNIEPTEENLQKIFDSILKTRFVKDTKEERDRMWGALQELKGR